MNEITEKRAVAPIVRFKQDLGRLVDAKELALPSNVSVENFRNAAIVAVQDNPQILNCQPETIFRSIRRLAAAGLVPDGREAALVPFNGSCTAIPMVSGLIKMARRSGDVKDVRAHLVYQNEIDQNRFTYVVGDEERLEHDPILFWERGDCVGTYAIAKLKDGTLVREFMSISDVERIRKGAASQRGSTGPKGIWKDHYDEMVKKTVIRRLMKRLDLSAEDMRHIKMDDDAAPVRDVTPAQEPQQRQNLFQRAFKGETQDVDPEPVQDAGDTIDGEIVDDTAKHWTENVDTSDAAPMDAGFDDGVKAFREGIDRTDCPFTDHREAAPWLAGWDQARAFAEKETDDGR